MPFSMRYLARETLLALKVSTLDIPFMNANDKASQERFPNGTEGEYAACIGRLVYYRYIYPIIMWVGLSIAIVA
jgi:Ras GTPase-activating-like protein IQGAP2/3